MLKVEDADAHHRKYRGAVIAGAIIGGAIAYHHYKKRRNYRHYRGYVNPRYRVRSRRYNNYYHRHYHRYNQPRYYHHPYFDQQSYR